MARPQAVLVSTNEDTRELEDLLYSLGYDVARKVVQRRERPDPATYIGTGKVEELRRWLGCRGLEAPPPGREAGEALLRAERRAGPARGEEREAARAPGAADSRDGTAHGAGGAVRLVAVNAALKPSQVAKLERLLGLEIHDRVRVILEIFQRRARTKEARLQVELARLRYERPLVREYIHLAKRGEHPGFLAGGAYAVDQYYRTIGQRMTRIQEELARIAHEREERRKHRRRGGFYLVSLAGYANAGKSSLLRRLSGEDVLVENRMFSTLETRTGRARVGGRDVLVTDTVGFIEGLPPELVKAFRSTLEEIARADVVVLVCDAHDPADEALRKLRTSLRVLREFSREAPVVLALNKADLVPAERRAAIEEAVRGLGAIHEAEWSWVSALRGEGVEDLVQRVLARLPAASLVRASLPAGPEGERVFGLVCAEAEVQGVRRDSRLEFEFRAPPPVAGRLRKRVREAGGVADVIGDASEAT